MKLVVNPHKIIINTNELVNEKEINVAKCEFVFSDDIPASYVKKALFTFKGTTYEEIINNNECAIPSEVLEEKGQIEIGVIAYEVEDEEFVQRFNPSPIYINTLEGSLKDEIENSSTPTPSELEQLESIIGELQATQSVQEFDIVANTHNIQVLYEGKQDILISDINIKTINNQSLLGAGNIEIQGGGGGTSNYNDLTNKPSINNIQLSGNKTLNELGIQPRGNYLTAETDPIFSASASATITNTDITNWNNKSEFSGDYNDLTNKPTIPTVPTNVSAFTNDAGYTTNIGTITSVKMNGSTISSSGEADLGTVITSHQDISGKLDTNKVKNTTSTTAGDVYDVTYINTMLGDIETILTTITSGSGV